MSSGSQKVSPRKFSEKIALLNKKEKEGNAKFEEIIKEVQGATKIIHSQQSYTSQSLTDPDASNDAKFFQQHQQLQRPRAIQTDSIDSQEEIDKVYENLMKCVDQEYEEEQKRLQGVHQPLVNQYESQQEQQFYDSNGRNAFRSSSAGLAERKIMQPLPLNEQRAQLVPSLANTANSLGLQQYANQKTNDAQQPTIDLNNNISHLHYSQPNVDKNHLSGQGPPNTYASTSYLSQNNQQTYTPGDNSNQFFPRARVVSFGSASSTYKHPSHVPQFEAQSQQIMTIDGNQAFGNQTSDCYQTNYLKEPAGDRSKQKSCSDPALHVSPTLGSVTMIASCNSENRLAPTLIAQSASTGTVQQPIMTFDNSQTEYGNRYSIGQIDPALSSCISTCCSILGQNNPVAGQDTQNSAIAARNQLRHQKLCDPTLAINDHCAVGTITTNAHNQISQQSNTHGEVPGIKICTIEDDSVYASRMPVQANGSNISSCTNDQSSRDSSLPDISNLQFGTNSLATSPEKHVVMSDSQLRQWPDDGSKSLERLNSEMFHPFGDSCQAIDGSWTSSHAGCQRVDNIDMDIQAESNTSLSSSAHQQQVSNQFTPQRTFDWPQHVNHLHHVQKINNISNSECGISYSGQQDSSYNSMICTAADFNNIMRSRSHSNIDYLARRNKQITNMRNVDENAVRLVAHHQQNNLQQYDVSLNESGLH